MEQAQRDVTKYEGKIKEQGKNGLWVGLDERNQYWKAKQREITTASRSLLLMIVAYDCVVVNSSIHPDTGKPVPLPFRMSAFVPTNLM